MSLRIETVTGRQLTPWLTELARLRIGVFRDFPYLYDGSLDYEMDYLATYTRCPHSICVLALEGERVVGASTGLPLAEEVEAFRAPFAAAGLDATEIFYCAESVLLPEYRGQGLYRAFFEGRERHAQTLGFATAAFCAVVRPEDHPLKPGDYRPLTDVWARFGYRPASGLLTRFCWKDLDLPEETAKPMQFYLKSLEATQ